MVFCKPICKEFNMVSFSHFFIPKLMKFKKMTRKYKMLIANFRSDDNVDLFHETEDETKQYQDEEIMI